jgi:hypothetical protein
VTLGTMSERPNRAKRATPARQTAEENENDKHKRRQKRRQTSKSPPARGRASKPIRKSGKVRQAAEKRTKGKSPPPRNNQKSPPPPISRRESASDKELLTRQVSTPLTFKDVEGRPILLRLSLFDASKTSAPKFTSLFHIGGSNEFVTDLHYTSSFDDFREAVVKILVPTKKTLAAHRNTGVELYTSKEPQKEAFRTTKKEDDLMAVMNDENWNQAILFKSYKVFNDSVADDSESDSDDIECCRLDVLVCTKDIKDDVAVVVTGGNTTGVNRNRNSKNTIRDDETRVEVFLMGMAMSEENDDDTAVEKVYKIPGHCDAIHKIISPPSWWRQADRVG